MSISVNVACTAYLWLGVWLNSVSRGLAMWRNKLNTAGVMVGGNIVMASSVWRQQWRSSWRRRLSCHGNVMAKRNSLRRHGASAAGVNIGVNQI